SPPHRRSGTVRGLPRAFHDRGRTGPARHRVDHGDGPRLGAPGLVRAARGPARHARPIPLTGRGAAAQVSRKVVRQVAASSVVVMPTDPARPWWVTSRVTFRSR